MIWGATFFKDTSAEAAGKLVADAADALGVEWNARMARPLFAAVATDTGWYRFGSTGAGTYQLASRLVEAGAIPAEIYGALYEQETLGRGVIGSTTDSGSVCRGSSPCGLAYSSFKKA